MKTVSLQLVVLELENGRRGVFFGTPLVGDDETENDCQVENIWFSNISELPGDADLRQLAHLAVEQFTAQMKPWH